MTVMLSKSEIALEMSVGSFMVRNILRILLTDCVTLGQFLFNLELFGNLEVITTIHRHQSFSFHTLTRLLEVFSLSNSGFSQLIFI